jgi:hypothetical protein
MYMIRKVSKRGCQLILLHELLEKPSTMARLIIGSEPITL